MIARQVHFEGRVQGVGFRFATKQLALEFEVWGWMRNLADGRVELWVQGDSEEVDGFVHAIRESSLAHHIQKVQILESAVDEQVQGFEIR